MTEDPSVLSADTSWGSHLVPLMACVVNTTGPVLEVGMGYWSTPLLHRYCLAAGRTLVSIEDNAKWTEQFKPYHVCHHKVGSANYDEYLKNASHQPWSVVFLDHSPGRRRAADAVMFQDVAEYILSHDYSGAEVYDPFQEVIGNWKYSKVAAFSPSTLVLSNTKEIPF